MLKIELSFTDSHLVKKLLDYAIAGDIPVHQLIEEIVFDAMHGNDIKGSLEDTTKQRFSAWKEKTIWQGPYMMTESNISTLSSRSHQIQPAAAKAFQGQTDEPKSDYQERVDNLMDKNLKERPETKAALFKPKSSAEVTAAGFDPVEKAAELLKPQEEQIEQSVTAADIMYLSWLDDAITTIKALPKGKVFVANQFLPKEATPEEARVFGKKLLQLITKHKLYASKRKGKSCMEYVKA